MLTISYGDLDKILPYNLEGSATVTTLANNNCMARTRTTALQSDIDAAREAAEEQRLREREQQEADRLALFERYSQELLHQQEMKRHQATKANPTKSKRNKKSKGNPKTSSTEIVRVETLDTEAVQGEPTTNTTDETQQVGAPDVEVVQGGPSASSDPTTTNISSNPTMDEDIPEEEYQSEEIDEEVNAEDGEPAQQDTQDTFMEERIPEGSAATAEEDGIIDDLYTGRPDRREIGKPSSTSSTSTDDAKGMFAYDSDEDIGSEPSQQYLRKMQEKGKKKSAPSPNKRKESPVGESGNNYKRPRPSAHKNDMMTRDKIMLNNFKEFLKGTHMNKAPGEDYLVDEVRIARMIEAAKTHISSCQVPENQATVQALVDWARRNFYGDDSPLPLYRDEETGVMTLEKIFQVLDNIAGGMSEDKRSKYYSYDYKGENVIRYGQSLLALGLEYNAGIPISTIADDLLARLRLYDKAAWIPAIRHCSMNTKDVRTASQYYQFISELHQSIPGQACHTTRRPKVREDRAPQVDAINTSGPEYTRVQQSIREGPSAWREGRTGYSYGTEGRPHDQVFSSSSSSSSNHGRGYGQAQDSYPVREGRDPYFSRNENRRNYRGTGFEGRRSQQDPMCWACGKGHASYDCNFIRSLRPNSRRIKGMCVLCPTPTTRDEWEPHPSSECPVLAIHYYLVSTNQAFPNSAFPGSIMDFYREFQKFHAAAKEHMRTHLATSANGKNYHGGGRAPRVQGTPLPQPQAQNQNRYREFTTHSGEWRREQQEHNNQRVNAIRETEEQAPRPTQEQEPPIRIVRKYDHDNDPDSNDFGYGSEYDPDHPHYPRKN